MSQNKLVNCDCWYFVLLKRKRSNKHGILIPAIAMIVPDHMDKKTLELVCGGSLVKIRNQAREALERCKQFDGQFLSKFRRSKCW